MAKTLWDKIWKDKTGRVVIIQKPNILLFTWGVNKILSLFVAAQPYNEIFTKAGLIALFFWSVFELYSGVNYFRRAVGIGVLGWLIWRLAL